MADRFKIKPGNSDSDAEKRVGLAERYFDTDPLYWEQPLPVRIYLRALYAVAAFVGTIWFFGTFSSLPTWMQAVLGVSVAVAVLVFRMAYPGGFNNIWTWVMEGMAEAAAEIEANGKDPKKSSKELKEALAAHKAATDAAREAARERKAEKKRSKKAGAKKDNSIEETCADVDVDGYDDTSAEAV